MKLAIKWAIFLAVPSIFLVSAFKPNTLPFFLENGFDQSSINLDLHQNPGFLVTSTNSINLPLVEQNSPETTPTPNGGYPEASNLTPEFTSTPTPIPVIPQTGSVNIPIVLGALAIIIVVVLAWLFISYLPKRKQT